MGAAEVDVAFRDGCHADLVIGAAEEGSESGSEDHVPVAGGTAHRHAHLGKRTQVGVSLPEERVIMDKASVHFYSNHLFTIVVLYHILYHIVSFIHNCCFVSYFRKCHIIYISCKNLGLTLFKYIWFRCSLVSHRRQSFPKK